MAGTHTTARAAGSGGPALQVVSLYAFTQGEACPTPFVALRREGLLRPCPRSDRHPLTVPSEKNTCCQNTAVKHLL